DTVFLDRNRDQVQDTSPTPSAEPGLEGVDVDVIWAGPDDVFGNGDDGTFTVTTDADGEYLVDFLPPGEYRVDVQTGTLPAGLTNTVDEDADDDSSTPVTLGAADDHLTADFGYAGDADIGDTVYLDLDGDGSQDPNEPGVPGQTVQLNSEGPDGILGTPDDIVLTTTTDADGEYLFENLPDGDYRVTVVGGIVDDATNTGDPDGGTPNQADLTIAGGVDDLTMDFGYQGDNSLGDTIWWDRNRDGVQDPAAEEPGLEGVDVTVTSAGLDGTFGTADDITVGTFTTDADGEYVATGLPDGDYRVDVVTSTVPAGMDNTFDADDGVVGDGGTDPDSSSTVTLPGATDDRAQDFGYAGTGSIGDLVYFDRDGDGTRDTPADEPGIAGVELTLTFAGTDGVLGTPDDIQIVQDADADGGYDFDGLPAGDYTVEVTDGLPSGANNTDDPDLPGASPDVGDSISSVTLGAGEDNDLQDFGYDVNAGLGDRVWWDFDRDGVQDTGEPGVEGVEITVTFLGADQTFGTADDEVFTDTTDASGNWFVDDIPEGDYRIEITDGVDAGFDNTFDPDTGPPGADGVATLLGHTGLDVAQDFGIAGDSSIGDTVWLDLDGDGTVNGQEVGLEGVVVELTWLGPDGVPSSDDQTFRTTTGPNGDYLFPGLPAGQYTVTVDPDGDTLPEGLSPSFDRDGTTVSPDGTTPVTLPAATAVDDVDFGYRGTSSIGDTVFFDRDRDRTQSDAPGTDDDEPGLPGVDVTLTWAGEDGTLGTADDTQFTTTTGPDGDYLFDGLPAGEYVVDVVGATLPTALTNTVDEDGDDDGSTPVTLGVGDDHLTADFGYAGTATIGDLVWLDLNGDGVQDGDEPGVPGQTVRLDGPSGTLTTTTGPDGSYSFDNLPDGTYTVTVVGGIVDEAVNTIDFDSPLGTGDSTSSVTIAGGVSNDQQDFGYQGSAALGDTIWFDVDADGVDDGAATEPRLGGVDVVVTWHGPDGVIGTADDIVLPTATTDANGEYLSENLPSGTFTVTPDIADVSNGRSISVDPDDGAVADGDTPDGSAVVTLATGETDLDQDFGYTGTGSIGDQVWLDLDGDGVIDPEEPGFEGATVTVTWLGPDGVSSSDDVTYVTTVADDGTYLVEHLPSGEFTVGVSGLPGGLEPTADPDGGDDSTSAVTLAPGEANEDQDFGYTGTAGVGDTVWFDLDDDGVPGPREPGVSGVTVTVTSAGVDGELGTNDDLALTTVTDADGRYGVTRLPAGPTLVAIDLGTLPSDAAPSADADGGDLAESTTILLDGAIDIDQDFGVRGPGRIVGTVFDDRDGDGLPDPPEPGRPNVNVTITYDGSDGPIVITVPTDDDGAFDVPGLPSGPYIVEVLPADEPVGTISTGPTSVAVTVADDDDPNDPPRADIPFVEPASVGQRVFVDDNRNGVQDPGEPGVPNATVTLLDVNGEVVATTTTDDNGDFVFDDVPPGIYTVEVDPTTLPTGFDVTVDGDGTVDGRTTVSVGPGDEIRTVVFGVSEPTLPTTGAALVWLIRIATMLLVLGAVITMLAWPAGGRRRDSQNGADIAPGPGLSPWGPPTGPRLA
ncbi:MAG: SdrD B-like domain-containing protein, partial [Actinomycetota bacterium]